MNIETLKLALEALENNRQTHHYCEDTWYSCPKHEDGCANESEGDECNCGADKANAEIDKAITAIKEALAQPEQEPVAVARVDDLERGGRVRALAMGLSLDAPLYTTPPQRKPLTRPQINQMMADAGWQNSAIRQADLDKVEKVARAIEAAHGIKEKNT